MSDPSRLAAALADRYRIEWELGQGGMATVYLAHDIKHDRQVAVKVLRPELAAILGVERFLAEIKVTANLRHPNLLPLFDSGEADGFLYYVMPYIEGATAPHRRASPRSSRGASSGPETSSGSLPSWSRSWTASVSGPRPSTEAPATFLPFRTKSPER